MNKKKRFTALAMAAALALSLLTGCGPSGTASGQSSSASSAAGSSSAEQVPPAPGASTSEGMGRMYADLVALYMEKSGLSAPVLADAEVKSGNDEVVGPHLKQTYSLATPVEMVVYTDPEDQHLLRVTIQMASVASANEAKVGQCAMRFVSTFFDAAEAASIQEKLHLTDAKKDEVYTVDAASGRYILMKNNKATSFDYTAK